MVVVVARPHDHRTGKEHDRQDEDDPGDDDDPRRDQIETGRFDRLCGQSPRWQGSGDSSRLC
jgi:hypothetical protein